MKIEDYKKAESLIKDIDSIENLTKDFSLGTCSESDDFTENNDDFYNANFIKVFETKGYHNTGGGHSDLSRLTVAKYKDMSGSYYNLSKSETIKLQEFLYDMLTDKLNKLKQDLENI